KFCTLPGKVNEAVIESLDLKLVTRYFVILLMLCSFCASPEKLNRGGIELWDSEFRKTWN
ncbi:17793_t:CDS:1, partial [Dentiscutata erythropus]